MEIVALTRCEGDDEGVGRAAGGESKTDFTDHSLTGSPVSCDFLRTTMGNIPKAHTKMVTRSVLGRKGTMSAFRTLNADIPPTFHVFQKMVPAHTGRMDNGRIS